MSFIKKSTSAIGKLILVVMLAATFLVGMVGVVYMSLQGEAIKVPEIIGKDFVDSEKELTQLGLRIKKRADRYSEEKPNTILEQLPKPGDTVKTGQMILVVTSKSNPEGEEKPATIKKSTDEDDTEKIEELISDKPKAKKTNSNTNTKKKSSTTRDVLSNNSTNSNSSDGNSSNSNSSNSNKTT
ncbi:MAG: PASTA domain-containing protein, partial [Pyrinomonadaceae bacterium]